MRMSVEDEGTEQELQRTVSAPLSSHRAPSMRKRTMSDTSETVHFSQPAHTLKDWLVHMPRHPLVISTLYTLCWVTFTTLGSYKYPSILFFRPAVGSPCPTHSQKLKNLAATMAPRTPGHSSLRYSNVRQNGDESATVQFTRSPC